MSKSNGRQHMKKTTGLANRGNNGTGRPPSCVQAGHTTFGAAFLSERSGLRHVIMNYNLKGRFGKLMDRSNEADRIEKEIYWQVSSIIETFEGHGSISVESSETSTVIFFHLKSGGIVRLTFKIGKGPSISLIDLQEPFLGMIEKELDLKSDESL